MFGSIGMPELILIFIVALLVFGPKKLPEIGKSLGKGIREFKGALSHIGDDESHAPPASSRPAPVEEGPPPAAPPDHRDPSVSHGRLADRLADGRRAPASSGSSC